jgi:hypothetical protein
MFSTEQQECLPYIRSGNLWGNNSLTLAPNWRLEAANIDVGPLTETDLHDNLFRLENEPFQG